MKYFGVRHDAPIYEDIEHVVENRRTVMAVMIPRSRALMAASKKIRVLSEKALNSNLDAFGFSRAECFRQGVEEAQNEIVNRIALLGSAVSASPESPP
jgi:hypothetical protein